MRIRMRICYYLSTCFIIRFEGDIDDISCARSNVSDSPFLSLSLPFWACCIYGCLSWLWSYAAQSVIRSSRRSCWQMCPKVAHVFDFCCVCEACRGDPKKVRRTQNFAPHCVCEQGEGEWGGNTFNSAHTLIHQSPAKSTSLIKLRWDFLLQKFLEYAHQT